MLPPEDVLQLVYRKVFDGVLRQLVASHISLELSIIAPAMRWRRILWWLRRSLSDDAPAGRKEYQAERRMYRFVLEAMERTPRLADEVYPAFCLSCSTRDGLRVWALDAAHQDFWSYCCLNDLAKELPFRVPCPSHLLLS